MRTLLLFLLILPVEAREGFPLTENCRPKHQKGIGVGNNNYHGHDCVRAIETEETVIIDNRVPASHSGTVIIEQGTTQTVESWDYAIEPERPHDYGE